MTIPATYDFVRYLEAKKSVDNRALNTAVWHTFWEALPPASRLRPLEVLELGAGTGTMLERILQRNLLHHAHYTALDADENNIAALATRVSAWAAAKPFVHVYPQTQDLFALLNQAAAEPEGHQWDVVLAHAFLDLIDLSAALPLILRLLRPGGLFYFTLNFDGETVLEPPTDQGDAFDDLVVTLYHQTMDERLVDGRRAGHSRTGRQLFGHLRTAGAEVLAAGSSDWVVFGRDGRYPHDEGYFLYHILHFFEQSLGGHAALDRAKFAAWLAQRRSQVAAGALVYIAHQLDIVGRVPEH